MTNFVQHFILTNIAGNLFYPFVENLLELGGERGRLVTALKKALHGSVGHFLIFGQFIDVDAQVFAPESHLVGAEVGRSCGHTGVKNVSDSAILYF
jgi:hypothetical protein